MRGRTLSGARVLGVPHGTGRRAQLRRAGVIAALLTACCLGVSPSALHAQAPPTTAATDGEGAAPALLVNLNTATVAELQRLPGVGPARAEAIVAYRERRPFRRLEELMRIRGIGRKTFRRLRPMLTLESPEVP